MSVATTIREKLQAALLPEQLDVVDESHKHKGHAGHRPGVETHFQLFIVSEAFDGKSRVARQRMVNQLLAEEIGNPIHALAMRTLTPAEARADAERAS
ncbi:MAG: BolA/IbaG family iron-sulfur metabolism protein [Rhizobiales bacterium]|nr:BolA/IbaG family iron-sulfur metabolism protein [Hyphomicrobiales bacterium]